MLHEQLWKRGRGAPMKFETPEHLWATALDYFAWCYENPLKEEKLFSYEGCVTRDSISKMRAMTEIGFCMFAGMDRTTWYDYCKRDDYKWTCEQIKAVIWEQKFTGAAADLLNANLIGKELGLVERKSVEGPNGGPVQIDTTTLSSETMEELLAARRRAEAGSDTQPE